MACHAPTDPSEADLLSAGLLRSSALEVLVDAAWERFKVSEDARVIAAAGLCALSLDHGRALRRLLVEVPPSAIALQRPQLEALVRAVWARHAAKEGDLARLVAPLTLESQQAAKKLPGLAEMLEALERSGPRGAAVLLGRAHRRLKDGLNSYIHGGIHPFQRKASGYPAHLLLDLLRNSNAFTMLSLIVLAELTREAQVLEVMSGLHEEFGDVLPSLEPF